MCVCVCVCVCVIIIIILRLYLCVRPCVMGGHRKSLDLEPKAAASLRHWRLEATERMPLCMLAKVLATGKTTSKFNVTDMNEIRVDTYFSWGPDSEAA